MILIFLKVPKNIYVSTSDLHRFFFDYLKYMIYKALIHKTMMHVFINCYVKIGQVPHTLYVFITNTS